MQEYKPKISVLGGGWLGLPLAEQLLPLGYRVQASTTTPAKLALLRAKNLRPFLLNLADNTGVENLPAFLAVDCLVICFPPRLRAGQGDQYMAQIELLVAALRAAPVRRVLFISSTSVYRDTNAIVTEADPAALDTASPLLQAEQLLQSQPHYQTTVLRFGGLVGGDRHPGRFLAGKTDVPQPEAPVNLIHLVDCLRLSVAIIAGPPQPGVFNAAADEHPSRREFYSAAARAIGLAPPQFQPAAAPAYKIISSEKIKAAYDYQFIHPDPLLFF